MRNITIAALFAVCLALPGMANATFISSPETIEMVQPGEMAPQLVHDILKAAAAASEFEYNCLCALYDNGEVWIEKAVSGGYLVYVQEGGGIGIIGIDESF